MFTIFDIIGLLVSSFAVWARNERKQDMAFIVGGVLLFAYSASIHNVIFTVLQVVFIASTSIELWRLGKKRTNKL